MNLDPRPDVPVPLANDTPVAVLASGVSAPRRRRLWPTLAAIVVVLALLLAWGLLKLPDWLREQGQTQLSELLGRQVRIERIELGLFPIRARMQGLRILEADGAAAGFTLAELSTQIDGASLLRRHPLISQLRIVQPELSLVRFADGHTNVDDLVRRFQARPRSDGVPPFSIANIELQGGAIRIDDRRAGARHAMEELQLSLPFLSSLPADQQVWVKPALRLKLDGQPIVARGESLPFAGGHKSRLNLEVADLDLAPWLVYWPKTAVIAPTRGHLATQVQVDFEQGSQTQLQLSGALRLREVGLQQSLPTVVFQRMDIQVAEARIERFELEPIAQRFSATGLHLVGPEVVLLRPAAGQAPKAEETSREAPARFAWQLGPVQVTQGRVRYEDPAFQPKALKLDLAQIEGRVQGLGADPKQSIQLQAQARSERGEELGIDARFAKAADQRSDLDWRLDKARLTDWWWLIEPHLLSTAKGGQLQAQGHVAFGGGKGVLLDKVKLSLQDLQLRSPSGIDWLRLGRLQLDDFSMDADARQLGAARMGVQGLSLLARRNAEGELSLHELLPPAARDVTGKGRPANPPQGRAPSVAPSGESARPWLMQLAELQLAGAQLALIDSQRGRDTDLKFTEVQVQARALAFEAGTDLNAKPAANLKPAQVSLSARLNGSGQIALKGPLRLQPLQAGLDVEAQAIDVLPFQPYFTRRINALVTQGQVDAQGRLELDLTASNPLSYAGALGLNRFASVTKAANEDLLKWRSLRLAQIRFALHPLKVDLGDIDLDDFYARLIISPQGRFNLQDLTDTRSREQRAADQAAASAQTSAQTAAQTPAQSAPSRPPAAFQNQIQGEGPTALAQPAAPAAAPAAAPSEPATQPLPVRIGRITLAKGTIDFSDFFVKPNYSAKLTDMGGEIGELTPQQPGALRLAGRIDGTGTLAIEGQINPLVRNLFLDLKANASDIDLPRLSPYSGKYIGYGIEKGKLSAKVAYKLENRQLQAQNNIILDQLTFGEKVDSPTALKLPIQFAVSLLKDRNGVIDVNMPIGGSIDAPDFSVSGLVMRMIGNLIIKVITSPFTFLASLGGGPQQELSTLGFETGQSALTPATIERLQSLAKVLADRPGLKLDMGGRADAGEDGQALRKRAFERLIKAQKLRESVRGNVASDLDAVTLSAEEYPRYLTLAYQRASFDKARNLIGLQKSLPVPEMEKLLNEHLKIGEAELLQLANLRAQAAKDWLAGSGGIGTDRLFITAPKLDGKTQVELSLK